MLGAHPDWIEAIPWPAPSAWATFGLSLAVPGSMNIAGTDPSPFVTRDHIGTPNHAKPINSRCDNGWWLGNVVQQGQIKTVSP
jgi:hypothetical protein